MYVESKAGFSKFPRHTAMTYLLPNRSSATELLARCFLRFGLVDFDHAAVELGLVHVVDGFEGVFREGEFDVAEASVRVLGGFS